MKSKDLSNRLRERHPLLVEAARLRHWRTPGFLPELAIELGSIVRDRRLLIEPRGEADVCWPPDETDEPLVTVRIATKDRPQQLIERALHSVLRQTYDRIEVVVVGDQCDERTETAVRQLNDRRVRFINLPRAGVYPDDPIRRWRVAGTKPMNVAVDLAAGTWIAPCDDDDEFTPDHVEKLLSYAKDNRLEFVWSLSHESSSDGTNHVRGTRTFGRGCTTHGAILYSTGLSFLRYSQSSYYLSEPADWNLMKRMRLCGVRMGFLNEITYKYFVAGPSQYES